MIDPVEFLGGLVIDIVFRNRFPVKIDGFIGSENNRGAMFQDPVIRKGFNNQFDADSVQVTAANTDQWFIGGHNCQCWGLKI